MKTLDERREELFKAMERSIECAETLFKGRTRAEVLQHFGFAVLSTLEGSHVGLDGFVVIPVERATEEMKALSVLRGEDHHAFAERFIAEKP